MARRHTTEEDEKIFRGLGTPVSPGEDISNVLDRINLNWEPAVSDIRYGATYSNVADCDQVLYRPHDGKYMGIISNKWYDENQSFKAIVQLFSNFCDDANINLERVGTIQYDSPLRNGSTNAKLNLTLFAVASIAGSDQFKLVGNDEVTGKLILRYPYTYGTGINVAQMAIRKVCINTMYMPVRTGHKVITHRSAVAHDKVLKVLEGAKTCWGQYQQVSELLTQTEMTKEVAMVKLIEAFGVAGKPLEKQPKVVQSCLESFITGNFTGGEMMSAYNTAWGLLQTVTEHFNHKAPSVADANRQINSLWSSDAGTKNGNQLKMYNLVKAFSANQRYGVNSTQAQMIRAW